MKKQKMTAKQKATKQKATGDAAVAQLERLLALEGQVADLTDTLQTLQSELATERDEHDVLKVDYDELRQDYLVGSENEYRMMENLIKANEDLLIYRKQAMSHIRERNAAIFRWCGGCE